MDFSYLYSDSIEKIERILRDLIHDLLTQKFGADWINNSEAVLDEKWVKGLRKKESQDKSNQRDQTLYNLPLNYTEFPELGLIIEKHKDLFDKVFTDWERFLELYKIVRELRNTIKHHRDISPSQQALLIGIAGEIERYVNFWRIGVQLDVKGVVIQFTDFIPVKGISDNEILNESINCIRKWKKSFIDTFNRNSIDRDTLNIIEEDPFSLIIKGHNIELTVKTNPKPIPNQILDGINYKGVHAELRCDSGCEVALDDFLEETAKRYNYLAYVLSGSVDIDNLYEWASRQAGITPSSEVSSNSRRYSIEYSFLKGTVRIGAKKGSKTGEDEILITRNYPIKKWQPHKVIRPEHLIGFMLGNSPPRAMMHLIQLSEI